MKILINDTEYKIGDMTDLERILNEGHDDDYREIWVERGVARMCALAAKDIAWLMSVQVDDGAGYSSRNPSYPGSEQETMAFELSNGQVDEYPVAWTLPRERWVSALLHFANTGERAENVIWHNDG